MTHVQELQSIISDMFKDAHGFRPRGEQFWSTLTTVEACNAKLDELQPAVDAAIDEDRAREAAAAVKFEARIAELIEHGAGDRETALRWLRDSVDAYGDDDLRWSFGLHYNYSLQAA